MSARAARSAPGAVGTGAGLGVLRLAPVPPADPPAEGRDWSTSATAPEPATHGYVQGCLAVDFRDEAYDSYFGPQATGTGDLPEPRAWVTRMIQAALEACDGTRSADQLSRWLTPEIRERVARRGALARRGGLRTRRAPVVRRVLLCHPADGVCEVAAVVWAQGRTRALALRMSGVDGRWLITAFELG